MIHVAVSGDKDWRENPIVDAVDVHLPMTTEEINQMWKALGLDWCFIEPWASERPQTEANVYAEMCIQSMYHIAFLDNAGAELLRPYQYLVTFLGLNEMAKAYESEQPVQDIIKREEKLVQDNLYQTIPFPIERG